MLSVLCLLVCFIWFCLLVAAGERAAAAGLCVSRSSSQHRIFIYLTDVMPMMNGSRLQCAVVPLAQVFLQ